MGKTVQIPHELFIQLLRYHWQDDHSPELTQEIRDGLERKVQAMARRERWQQQLDKNNTAP